MNERFYLFYGRIRIGLINWYCQLSRMTQYEIKFKINPRKIIIQIVLIGLYLYLAILIFEAGAQYGRMEMIKINCGLGA